MINNKKIALVLSGGASKGFAHIGALKILEKNGIVPDFIIGTSMGSVIGGLYASGMTIEKMEERAINVKLNEFVDVNIFNMFRRGVISGKKLVAYIDRLSNNAMIQNLKIPFVSVACDLKTGKQYLFKSGKLSVAVRTSSSVPGLFAPLKYENMLLVDGGVINNNPTSVAKDMGADYIISVDCIGTNYLMKEIKSTFDVMMASFNIVQHEYELVKKDNADTKIVVDNDRYGFTEHTAKGIKEIIKMGESATQDKIEKIKIDLQIN